MNILGMRCFDDEEKLKESDFSAGNTLLEVIKSSCDFC